MKPLIEEPDLDGVKPAWLSPRQQADLAFLRQHVPAAALWHEVGVGKTHPVAARVLEIVRPTVEGAVPPPREGGYTMEERGRGLIALAQVTFGGRKRALVLMKKSILPQWREKLASIIKGSATEHPEWQDVTVGVLRGGLKPENLWGRGYDGVPDIVLMNYDYVPSLAKEEGGKLTGWLAGLIPHLGVVVADEAQKLKGFRGYRSSKAVRARLVNRIAEGTPLRIGMSGSPVLKPTSSDLWAVYHFLDPTIFGPTRWKFISEFFYDTSKDYRYEQLVLKPGLASEMSRRLYMIARRITKKECPPGEFPDVRRMRYDVELPSSVRSLYDDLEKQGIAADANGQITRLMLLSRLMALQQIASGFIIDDSGEARLIDVSHKKEQLDDLVEEIDGQPFVVWAHFRHEIEWLTKYITKDLGITALAAYGGNKGNETERACDAFKRGDVNVLVGQPASVGVGMDFQRAQHAIRWSRSYNMEDFIQSEGRTNRAHSQFDETVHHEIVCVDTKDQDIYEALINGVDLASMITLDHLLPAARNA